MQLDLKYLNIDLSLTKQQLKHSLGLLINMDYLSQEEELLIDVLSSGIR